MKQDRAVKEQVKAAQNARLDAIRDKLVAEWRAKQDADDQARVDGQKAINSFIADVKEGRIEMLPDDRKRFLDTFRHLARDPEDVRRPPWRM